MQSRAASIRTPADELRGKYVIEAVRERDPIAFLNRRSDALTQRAAELKQLANAWQPVSEMLSAVNESGLGLVLGPPLIAH